MDAGLKCCVVFLGKTVDSHSVSLQSVGLISIVLGSWQFLGKVCDRLVSYPDGLETCLLLLVTGY